MEDTVEIHRRYGLTNTCFRGLIESAKYNPGVPDVLGSIDRSAFEIVLISGGFRELTSRVQMDFGIHHAFAACEYFFGSDGFLSSYNLLPCDFEGKFHFVQLMLKSYGFADDEWIFVGDGKNDTHVAEKAPYAIGYRAHPQLAELCRINLDDFSLLIPALNDLIKESGRTKPVSLA